MAEPCGLFGVSRAARSPDDPDRRALKVFMRAGPHLGRVAEAFELFRGRLACRFPVPPDRRSLRAFGNFNKKSLIQSIKNG